MDATGLGTYRIVVDRAGRPAGTYSTFVEFRSTAGDQRVDILMQVATSPIVPGAGRHYVVLVDESTLQITQQVAIQVQGEEITDLGPELPALRRLGVGLFRVQPRHEGTAEVVAHYARCLSGQAAPVAIGARNGYWHGEQGMVAAGP